MSTITKEQAQKIIEASDEVITALAGTNEDVHPESDSMLRLWDDLNDRYAPPEVVRELARIALASLEAEPVAFVMADDLKDNSIISTPAYRDLGEAMERTVGDVVALFTAPPAPVSVPDAATAIRACMEEFPESVRDIVEECASIAENACRAAMLQGAETVTTDYKLPFDKWLSQQYEPVDVDCGCVTTEAFNHWLRVAYEAGNSPVIPDGWVLVPIELTPDMREAWDSAPNTDDDDHNMQAAYRAMIAAAPQQEVK